MAAQAVPCATFSTKVFPGCAAIPSTLASPADNVGEWPYQAAQLGAQDLLAFSSFSQSGDIFVVDINSMQLVQSLHGHTAPVNCVQWQPPPASYLQHGLCLLSGDRAGVVVLWDVIEGVALNTVCLPGGHPISLMSFLTAQHLLIVTQDSLSYVYDAHLALSTPMTDVAIPTLAPKEPRQHNFHPMNVVTSPFSLHCTTAFVLGDRVRIIGNLDVTKGRKEKSWGKDLIYDSEDGNETVLDAAFSTANEEVLFFATRNSICCYDWKLRLMLNDQVLWHSSGVEFRRIFPSSPVSVDEDPTQLPLLYSFNTDQRLSAWYTQSNEKFVNVSVDVRGARMPSKVVASVVQSAIESTLFAVVFVDGSVARWRYRTVQRGWVLESYLGGIIVRPTCVCCISDHVVCCALDTGHIALLDALYGTPLRRYNVVYAGGTRIVAIAPFKWGESVWVVTDRVVHLPQQQQQKHQQHYHQITLFDTRTGEVLQVLRRPPRAPEPAAVKEISMDSTHTFLLVVFTNGFFEVWCTENGSLLHVNNGNEVTHACWAPESALSSLTNVHGSPQLLAAMVPEGNAVFYTVYKERVVRNRSIMQLFCSNNATVPFALCAGDALVCVDSNGFSSVLHGDGGALCVSRLKDVPQKMTALHMSVTTVPVSGENHQAGSEPPSHTKGTTAAPQTSVSYIAIIFDDRSFGVWNSSTRVRLGHSTSNGLQLPAMSTAWLGELLVVLSIHGTVVLVDKHVTSVNSSFVAKCLRRPICNSAFLLPAHRTYIQSSLEIAAARNAVGPVSAEKESTAQASTPTFGVPSSMEHSGMAHEKTPKVFSPSYLMKNIELSRRPCRGPYGHIITADMVTLQHELDLYARTVIPKRFQRAIDCATSEGRVGKLAFWAARIFGQREKQRFWAMVCVGEAEWGAITGPAPPAASTGGAPRATSSADGGSVSGNQSSPFFSADPYSEGVSSASLLRHNRNVLNVQRINAMQALRFRNVDDTSIRLSLARDLIRLSELDKATEVLVDSNFESDQYNALATLGVAVAACASLPAVQSPLFSVTTKRAAAMLLAKGDLEAAIEKFSLAGNYSEACLTLQSRGRWSEAAVAAKLSPMSSSSASEVIHRWAKNCALQGEFLGAARMMLSLSSPLEALALLADSAHLTDVAGLFALALHHHYEGLSADALNSSLESAFADAKEGSREPTTSTLRGVLTAVFTDYSSVLESVGNADGVAVVRTFCDDLQKDRANTHDAPQESSLHEVSPSSQVAVE